MPASGTDGVSATSAQARLLCSVPEPAASQASPALGVEAAADPSGVAAEAGESRGAADDNVDRRTARLGLVAYPRSAWLAAQLAGAGAGADVGPALAAAADWSEGRTAVEGLPWRRFSKTVVELDRNQWAVERHGYQTWLLSSGRGSAENEQNSFGGFTFVSLALLAVHHVC